MATDVLAALIWLAAAGLAGVTGVSLYALARARWLTGKVAGATPARSAASATEFGHYVKLAGVARPQHGPRTAPLSGERCAWWWAQARGRGATERHTADGVLLLDVAGELVEVHAADAELHPAQINRYDARVDPFRFPAAKVWPQHHRRKARGPVRLAEWRVGDGDSLLAAGWLERRDGRVVLTRGNVGRPLFLAQGDEAQLAVSVTDAGEQLIRAVMLPAAASVGLFGWGLALLTLL